MSFYSNGIEHAPMIEQDMNVMTDKRFSMKRIFMADRFGGRGLLVGLLLMMVAPVAVGSALDDKIETFERARAQTDADVAALLALGRKEQRHAEAFYAVKGWFSANPSVRPELLFDAARVGELAGEYRIAASLYRKLLKSKRIPAAIGAKAVPGVYRLLLNKLRDKDAAYLLMREAGNDLRHYGRAKQFDRWFVRTAKARNDLAAIASRLAAICRSRDDDPSEYAGLLDWLFQKLGTFEKRDEEVQAAMDDLAQAATRSPEIKLRWNWIRAVASFSPKAGKRLHARKDIPADLFAGPVKIAKALTAREPVKGTKLVAAGWARFTHGHTPLFLKFVHAQRDLKAQPIILALRKLKSEQALRLLNTEFKGPRGRNLRVSTYLSPAVARSLALEMPSVFNSLSLASVSLWDKEITVDEAKKLSPRLVRNANKDAALIRSLAISGEKTISAMLPALMKTERWRFSDAKSAVDAVWHSGVDTKGANHKELVKQYKKAGAHYEKLSRQVEKKAKSRERLAAFNNIYGQLVRGRPVTQGLLSLWDDLFSNAPDGDKVTMLKKLASNLTGDREYLLRRATAHAQFGKSGKLFWQADVYNNHFRYHQRETREHGAAFIAHLAELLKKQVASGALNETLFGLWLQAVNAKKEENVALLKAFMKSPAYQKLSPAYRRTAADGNHFGSVAYTPSQRRVSAKAVSKELLALGDKASPAAVAGALKRVVSRLQQVPVLVPVFGLERVEALPTLEGATLERVLSLFTELAPIGGFPRDHRYAELATRLVRDAVEAEHYARVVPHLGGLWLSADVSRDSRRCYVADALLKLGTQAMEAGEASVASAVARTGLRSGVFALDPNDRYNPDASSRRYAGIKRLAGKAGIEMGAFEIPVDKTDPAYGLYRSQAEYVLGNEQTAWELYEKRADAMFPGDDSDPGSEDALIRKLALDYVFWLVDENIRGRYEDRAEALVRALLIWASRSEGALSPQQEAELRLDYARIAFQRGKLPTARAWFRKVADAREYQGSEVHVRASLGMVTVDRVSKNFAGALGVLDKLSGIRNPRLRSMLHFARAEVLVDQEAFKEAAEQIEAVLRYDRNHSDALILQGDLQIKMRKLDDASVIEMNPSQDSDMIVPGESVKIDLRDPTLSVSGLGADIEVEIWAKSGDRERVMLHQFGDDKQNFRAEVPTALGSSVKGDKVLQILGEDEIRFGYSKRFRAKMEDLPPDPDIVIGIASDAYLSFSAGAFPPRKGERKLNIDELGLSTAQRRLGMRRVRPGNPVYIRVTDLDQSKAGDKDKIIVSLRSSSGDVIRRLMLEETAPYSGEFQATVKTAGAQAMAFASDYAPGRDPNMAISAEDYPGWAGNVGRDTGLKTFGVDLNDNASLGTMTVDCGGDEQALTHFVLQTSMNGRKWKSSVRYPLEDAPWDGRPRLASFPTYRHGIKVPKREGNDVPDEWREAMEVGSISPGCNYLSAYVKNVSGKERPITSFGHPGYSGISQFRALFYQSASAIRRFRLDGFSAEKAVLLIDGQPTPEDAEDPLFIERELAPGLHEIEVWRHDAYRKLRDKPGRLLCDLPGKKELVPCADSMFDPSTFPEKIQAMLPVPPKVETPSPGVFTFTFGPEQRTRLLRFAIVKYKGVAPAIKSVGLNDADGGTLLPVEQDFKALRENEQLEVLPGDQIFVTYEDDVSATPRRNKHTARLSVAYNTATIMASFINFRETETGLEFVPEPIRRFDFGSDVAIVINDADMDVSPKHDTVDFRVLTSSGKEITMKARETDVHSGRFRGSIFPVNRAPKRPSDIQVAAGETITAVYRDVENLTPGIPTDRRVVIEHARYATPSLEMYAVESEPLPMPEAPKEPVVEEKKRRRRISGPETFFPRFALSYAHVPERARDGKAIRALIGTDLRFDVVVPHLALAGSSEVVAYVQNVSQQESAVAGSTFNIGLPGTLKLAGHLVGASMEVGSGYRLDKAARPPTNRPPLDEGRFFFSVPVMLGDYPMRSYATQSAEQLPASAVPDGIAVRAGDRLRIGFAYKDRDGKPNWKLADVVVGGHEVLDVMKSGYNEVLGSCFVGEKVYLRLVARNLDVGESRDNASVRLRAGSGTETMFNLRETEMHTGVFKGVFALSYADEVLPKQLPPVELNGFPVRYGDRVTVSYEPVDGGAVQSHVVHVNMGADGLVDPFSKRFTGGEMAVQTSFTMAECFFELAKKHRKMEQESLARREIGHARKLLAEAVATYHEEELRAQAEYLLGNLSQEFADLAKNEQSKRPMYEDALSRFAKITMDYADSEFAPKAQFKVGLVYERLGQFESSVEEYVKLAYKYPDSELIPKVMSRLGSFFQNKGMVFKKQADVIREEEDNASKAEVLRLDELAAPEFVSAAIIFGKLQERFPDDRLAGLAGVRGGQNYMRAQLFAKAVDAFRIVVDNESYDGRSIRARALYWMGISYEGMPAMGWKARGNAMNEAYKSYRRLTFDFPDSKWAKYARGRLADKVFEDRIEKENLARERMLESLKNSMKGSR